MEDQEIVKNQRLSIDGISSMSYTVVKFWLLCSEAKQIASIHTHVWSYQDGQTIPK